MSLDFTCIKDIVFSKDFIPFLQNYTGSIILLFEALENVKLRVFNFDQPKNKKEIYECISILSLVPELLEKVEYIRKQIETHSDNIIEDINFNDLLSNIYVKKLFIIALENVQLSDLDYYDLANRYKIEKKGKYCEREKNKEIIKKFYDRYYTEDSSDFEEAQTSRNTSFIGVVEELKIIDQMDLYDILNDYWNCMQKEDIEYFNLSDEISQHLMKRY